MSVTAAADARIDGVAGDAARGLLDRPAKVILLGAVLAFALSWPRLLVIWSDNTFFDTDDAMRLVQVRNWLSGQGWFDLVEHRLFPPAGLLMHWSRVVDVPVGGLIRLFKLFVPPDAAERLARIVFPLAVQVALIAVAVNVGRLLAGPAAMVPAMVLLLLSGFTYEQFPPGRIDHHAPQITLLLAMTGAILSSLSPGRAWHAAMAGLCIATSLAISLENLPFMAVIVAILPLVWLADPVALRKPLLWFAGSLAVAVPLMFVATIPPARYGDAVYDALSIAHLVGVLAGAAGFAILALLGPRLPAAWQRVVTLCAVGGAAALVVLIGFPACLRDPYAGMDPVLKTLWLSHVTEAQPLMAATRARPDTFTMLFCPLLLGAGGAALAVWRERGLARIRWTAILALTLVGIAGTLWEIRVAASTQPLALLGGVWVVCAILRLRGASLARGALACVVALPFSTMGWAVVPAGDGDADAAEQLLRGQACRATAGVAQLAALPPGIVFAPIDDGSHLLVATPLSVVAAPYHRNQRGNRLVIDGFMAPPAAAEAIVRGTGARYLAFCPGEVEITLLSREAPAGLGARLLMGDVPDWLRSVPIADTPMRVYALR